MSTPTLDIAGNKIVSSMGRKVAKLSEFAHDYAGDYSAVGAVVKMPVLSAVAGVFNASTNNYEQSSTISEASINLSSQYVAGFTVTPKQMSDGMGAYNGLFNELGDAAGRAIARSVEDSVVGQVLSSASTETLTQTKAGFAGLYKLCYEHNLSPENCVLVLNPTAYSKLIEVLGDVPNLQKVIENGYIENYLGFARIIASSSVATGLAGFIAEKGAIGIVARRIPLLENYPFYQEYIDENTGLPVTLIGFQKFATGNMQITATALFGTSIVDPNGIVTLA